MTISRYTWVFWRPKGPHSRPFRFVVHAYSHEDAKSMLIEGWQKAKETDYEAKTRKAQLTEDYRRHNRVRSFVRLPPLDIGTLYKKLSGGDPAGLTQEARQAYSIFETAAEFREALDSTAPLIWQFTLPTPSVWAGLGNEEGLYKF